MAKRKTQIESPKTVARAPVTDESAKSVGHEQTLMMAGPALGLTIRENGTTDIADGAARLNEAEEPAGAAGRARLMRSVQGTLGNARVSQLTQPALLQRQPNQGDTKTAKPPAPKVGTPFNHPPQSHSPHKLIQGEFDGSEFVLNGDGKELMRVSAASGRPVSVRSKDAKKCGGSTGDSYLNNPRYVGIPDYGPIPEGKFAFSAEEFATFTLAEQMQFTLGGQFTDPFGKPMHGGDWGAGRAPLHKQKVLPAPKGCGDTAKRSGFFIHGGSLAGSSGCIDIGNAAIATLLNHLTGYKKNIVVTVKYSHAAPTVSPLGRTLGGFTYPGQENPSLMDRLGGAVRELFGGENEEQ